MSWPGGARSRVGRISLVLVLVGSLVGFAALTAAVIADGRAPLAVDSALHAWMLRRRTPLLTATALVVTATGSGVPAYVLTAAGGWFASSSGRRRQVRGAVVALAALLLGQGIRLLILLAVHRPRPPRLDWAGSASGAAYPSGHATTSALVAAVLCVAAARTLPRRSRRAVEVIAMGWAAAVGVTRVYLGVHWPTDVLGGWLFAAALVAAACLVASTGPARILDRAGGDGDVLTQARVRECRPAASPRPGIRRRRDR